MNALDSITNLLNDFFDGFSSEVIATAARLIDRLPAALPRPQLSASDDGEIGFSWFIDGNRFEAIISQNALVWVSRSKGRGQLDEQLDIYDENALPSLFTALSVFHTHRNAEK